MSEFPRRIIVKSSQSLIEHYQQYFSTKSMERKSSTINFQIVAYCHNNLGIYCHKRYNNEPTSYPNWLLGPLFIQQKYHICETRRQDNIYEINVKHAVPATSPSMAFLYITISMVQISRVPPLREEGFVCSIVNYYVPHRV